LQEKVTAVSKSEPWPAETAQAVENFDLDDPELPREIDAAALTSGGFPYHEKLGRKPDEKELQRLQIELIKLQASLYKRGERLVVLYEGRDAAGKGSAIKGFMAHLNPRRAQAVALSKPSEVEAGQWHFQRSVPHLPVAGNIVLFDRSWYKRAGVEKVMGYCTASSWPTFCARRPNLKACSRATAFIFSSSISTSVGRCN
jgi:polyphosphate kinase